MVVKRLILILLYVCHIRFFVRVTLDQRTWQLKPNTQLKLCIPKEIFFLCVSIIIYYGIVYWCQIMNGHIIVVYFSLGKEEPNPCCYLLLTFVYTWLMVVQWPGNNIRRTTLPSMYSLSNKRKRRIEANYCTIVDYIPF
jgi:hypothetical protein